MNYNESICIIEALLFASGEPISLDRLSEASGIEPETVVKLIDRLERKYNVSDSAIRVLRLENSYQLSTREEYAPLEVLAVVAYNQPVTKAFVEQVRGTDSSGVINTLVERELLYEAGRLELPGRPITYKTTDNFLRCFKLESLAQLPSLPDEDGQLNLNEIGTLQQDGDFIPDDSFEE